MKTTIWTWNNSYCCKGSAVHSAVSAGAGGYKFNTGSPHLCGYKASVEIRPLLESVQLTGRNDNAKKE